MLPGTAYQALGELKTEFPLCPILALTATASKKFAVNAAQFFKMRDTKFIVDGKLFARLIGKTLLINSV